MSSTCRWMIAAAAPLLLGACQTLAGTAPATVDLNDPAIRSAVTAALAQAVNRARVELGPSASPQAQVVTVLPPPPGPHETHSTAMPVDFDIVLRGGKCVAIRRDTATAHDLPGVTCRPVG